MNKCLCGCGREFEVRRGGQPRKFYDDACKMRYNRMSKRNTEIASVTHEPVKPILKYPGAKWNLAQWIISYLPEHKTYVEPFFGSGAVFFSKAPAEYEVINDLSSSVTNLFKVIREHSQELIDLVEMTPWARDEYRQSEIKTGDAIEDARRFLVRCWMAHGTRTDASTGWCNRGPSRGGTTVSRWNALPKRIKTVAWRLKSPEIENTRAEEVILKFSSAAETLIYCDPPYVLKTRAGKMYQHEMEDSEHITLLDALNACTCSVVLSGYNHPLYTEKLSEWTLVTAPAMAEKGKYRTECLWINPVAWKLLNRQPSLFDEAI